MNDLKPSEVETMTNEHKPSRKGLDVSHPTVTFAGCLGIAVLVYLTTVLVNYYPGTSEEPSQQPEATRSTPAMASHASDEHLPTAEKAYLTMLQRWNGVATTPSSYIIFTETHTPGFILELVPEDLEKAQAFFPPTIHGHAMYFELFRTPQLLHPQGHAEEKTDATTDLPPSE